MAKVIKEVKFEQLLEIKETESENGKSNVYYAEYLPEANCWTTPVDISYQGDYIEKLSVFTIDGSNILTMLSKEVAISDDSINDVCSLCSMEDTPFTDLEVIKVNKVIKVIREI